MSTINLNFQSVSQMKQELLVHYIWKSFMTPKPEQSPQSQYVLNNKYKQMISWRHWFTNSSPDAKLRNLNNLPGPISEIL